jgi:hypothetical protein
MLSLTADNRVGTPLLKRLPVEDGRGHIAQGQPSGSGAGGWPSHGCPGV